MEEEEGGHMSRTTSVELHFDISAHCPKEYNTELIIICKTAFCYSSEYLSDY